ncbi:MAG: NlpC/P60 family protein [Miltoncostaeaceae bacterium]
MLIGAALAGGVAVAPAGAQSDVERKRAQVQQIESELAGIDARLEDAANEFNGARYRLDTIQEDIRANQQRLNATEKALAVSRVRLGERMVRIYTTPQPSTIEVIVTSGSISEAGERLRLLERVGQNDGALVKDIKADRTVLAAAKAELVEDRGKAEKEVAAAEQRRREVEELLRQRQAVLSRARGELAVALRAEEQRRARIAAQERATALARQQAQSREPSSPSSPAPTSPSPASPAPSAPVAIPSGAGNGAAASLALQFLGTPYRWGGAAPGGFDCSGLCSYVYGKLGKSVPHYTVAIWNAFPKVPRDQLQPGDMVFFRGLGHMGIYIGGNQYVHAPSTGDVVKVSSMSGRSDYVGAVRP